VGPAREAGQQLLGSVLERTLQRLLGPSAPIEALLESALVEAHGETARRESRESRERPALLALQRIAAGVALDYLKSDYSKSGYLKSGLDGSAAEPEPAHRGSVRETLFHLHDWLRSSRAEDQLAFALLELSASPLLEVAAILRVSPTVVRQRAARVRRQLLFAARSDRLLARYLRLEPRLVGLLRCWDHATLAAPPSRRASRISAAVELELDWFV
jgi:DNA-directed RNA polymerase specialized sigma24 family protein